MDEKDLGRVFGEAVVRYGVWAKNNGLPDAFKQLANNGSAVVEVFLREPNLRVVEGPDVDAYEAEISNLKAKVEEQKKEIKSLNVLLEEQKTVIIETPPMEESEVEPALLEPIEEKPKPKRKRKQK